jgi:hypothetical protein
VKENTVDEVEIMKQIGSFLVKESEEGVSGAACVPSSVR